MREASFCPGRKNGPAGKGTLDEFGVTRRSGAREDFGVLKGSGRGRTSAIPIPANKINPAADGVGAGQEWKRPWRLRTRGRGVRNLSIDQKRIRRPESTS